MDTKRIIAGIAVGATLLSTPIVPVGEMELVSQSIHICNEGVSYYPIIPGEKPVEIDRGYSDPLFCDKEFSVAEFSDSSGNKVFTKSDVSRYSSTTKKGGEIYNATKQELASVLELAIAPSIAEAAIAYVNSARNLTPSTGTSYNVSYTAGSGTNRGLVFTFMHSPPNITAVSYNGVSATLVQNKTDGFGNGLITYRLENPDSGTHNITMTLSATAYVELVSVEYSGVDQTNMEDMSMQTEVTGTPSSPLTLTGTVLTNDSWLISTVRNAVTPIMTAGAGVGAVRQSGVTTQMSVGDSNATVSAGSQSQTWTTGAGTKSLGIMMAIKPASTVVNTTNNGCRGELHGTWYCQK